MDSCNGRLRDELLNETRFSTLGETRQKIHAWPHDDNHHRPHSGLGNIPPAEFIAMKGLEMRAAQPRKSTCGPFERPEESRAQVKGQCKTGRDQQAARGDFCTS